MPIYEHRCLKCYYEWEDFFNPSDPLPTKCPSCKKQGKIKKLISLCETRVALHGRENFKKQWQEGKKIAREARKSPDIMANIVGEEKYHKQQLEYDKLKKEIK